ncbi:CaiB/BaiF CoA transferase family protein [Nonomuraea wenchangensis]|uniref:CaiB/BaiF CoA transferase family protein n=1 Tax=Nonomuraea wenchangensis TaxID=568860 RepID=UPI00379D90C6
MERDERAGTRPGGPLSGLKVVDFSELAPGPFLTRCLRDLGAEVDKVERPGRDGAFTTHPGTYQVLNDGKRIHALDLKRPAGLEAAETLVAEADVLVEGFRPGVMTRLGLGFDKLSARHPGLVYVSISGFGQDGSLSRVPGHDLNYLAASGMLSLMGGLDDPPSLGVGVPIGDLLGSMYALSATLTALLQRNETGLGRHLDVSITDCLMHGMNMVLGQLQADRRASLGECREAVFTRPAYGVFETSDGEYVSIAALEEHFWQRLVAALGLEVSDLGLENRLDRLRGTREINGRIAEAVRGLAAKDVIGLLEAADVPVMRVTAPLELAESTQARDRGLFTATGEDGLGYVRFPVRFEG